MKLTNYLTGFCVCLILADSCRQRTDSGDAATGNPVTQTNTDPVGLTNLCDPGEKAYVLPVLGLPNASTVPGYKPGANNDSILKPYLQNRANELSWRTFIAMNWPATQSGSPDSTRCFGSRDGRTVWEHWMPGSEVFRADNQPPKAWQYGLSLKGHPENSIAAPVFKNAKLKNFSVFNADRYVLPNQYGTNTLYEVYYSREAYDYIVGGKLYSIEGQRSFAAKWPRVANGLTLVQNSNDTVSPESVYKRAYLPIGGSRDTSFAVDARTAYFSKNLGAIMVKSAWTILTTADDAAKYHTRRVIVAGQPVTLGLVGLHIAHKLAEAPRWVWSTFEHIGNAPLMDEHGKASLKPGVDYLYFDEAKNDTSTYNKPPTNPETDKWISKQRVQIVRLQKRTQATDLINTQFHDLIRQVDKKSVWLQYRLVGTQWPFNQPGPFVTSGATEPALLANAVLETYHQSTSSCMGCHQQARFLADKTHSGYFADFAWGMALGTKAQ